MSVKIRYKDVALGADKDATITTTPETLFSDSSKIPYGVAPPAVATCELNGWGLSHNYKTLNNQLNNTEDSIGFWSTGQSGNDCVFSIIPTITIDFTKQYTSTGLTIQFAVNSNDYCRSITVTWYQGGTIKDKKDFAPSSPLFVVNNTVVAFDKIVIEFKETNLPNKRCKVEGIIIGVIRDFDETELKEVKAIHEVDLISNTVPVNVLDASIHSKDDVDYIFQKKQPVEMFCNGGLIGVYYIDKGERTGKLDFSFSCQDKIGLLDLVTTPGHLWFGAIPLEIALLEVFGDIYEFEIDPAFSASMVKGFIKPETKWREALQHICFSIGAAVDTTGTHKIRIFKPDYLTNEIISNKETYVDGKITTTDTITAVEMAYFTIYPDPPENNEQSIEFEGVKYKYETGFKYSYNPNTVTSDPENVKKYSNCYLVHEGNAQELADNIMKYYQKRNKYSFKHVLNGQQLAGRYTASLPWEGIATGNITKMTVSVSNITVSDSEMLLD